MLPGLLCLHCEVYPVFSVIKLYDHVSSTTRELPQGTLRGTLADQFEGTPEGDGLCCEAKLRYLSLKVKFKFV